MPPESDLPSQARCVIIGGGLAGTSIAYHLAGLGWKGIILMERADLTSGSTWHSAGFVGQLRASVTLTRMMMYSVELYRRLKRRPESRPAAPECGAGHDRRGGYLRRVDRSGGGEGAAMGSRRWARAVLR